MKNQKKTSPFFYAVIGLSLLIGLLGLVAVYNASVVEAFNTFHDRFYFVKQQSTWLLIGLCIMLSLSFIDPKYYKKISIFALLGALFFMIIVLVPGIGMKLQGARRWLSLGFFRFQPSELLKLALIVYLAAWLEKPQTLKHFAVIIFFCLGLIMLQPDLGTAITIVMTGFGLFYLSGSKVKEILIFVSVLALAMLGLIFSSPYRLERVHTFLDPTSDILGRSYHINQVILGLGSGGMFGVGLGRSRQKYAYVPEATTDSIFSIIGEETGLIGGLVIISLMVAMSLLAFKIASRAPDQYRRLLAAGVALLFASQSFVNLSSMVALTPLTGVPLPLISYGGSSLITTFIGLGILAEIAKKV